LSITLLLFDLLIIIVFFIAKNQSKPATKYVLGNEDASLAGAASTSPAPIFSPTPSPTPSIILPSASLEQAVVAPLTEAPGSYGIVVKNLKTGENYSYNEHIKYESASLYKLWVMAETFEQIKSGKLKEDDILSGRIASQSAQPSAGAVALSVSNALNKMITVSDNYAALLLSSRIGLPKVASFLKTNGFKESNIGSGGNYPMTTAYDTAVFFEKLYSGKLINREYSDKMLKLLKAQKVNNKIPKYFGPDIVVAHKTGELDDYSHDAGIVYTQKGDYIIVLLSKNHDTNTSKNLIAIVSKSVFNYFTKDK